MSGHVYGVGSHKFAGHSWESPTFGLADNYMDNFHFVSSHWYISSIYGMGSHYLPELISVTWLLCLILLPILDELEQYTQRNLQLREISGAARSVEGDEWSVQRHHIDE